MCRTQQYAPGRLCVALAAATLPAACGASDAPAVERGVSEEGDPERARQARLTFVRVPASPSGLIYALAFDVPLGDVSVDLVDDNGTYPRTSDAYGLVELPDELADSFQVIVRARSLDGQIEVYDYESGAAHAWQSPPIERLGAGVAPVRIPSGWGGSGYTEPRAAAAFAVFDTARRVLGPLVRLAPRALPALRINWSDRNLPVWGSAEDGLIGTTRWDGATLHLLGAEDVDTDEYDEGVIAHELGHFVLEALGRNASPGGGHDLDAALDPRLAFTEGFASFLAAHSLGVSGLVDTFGPRQSGAYENDLETTAAEHAGWFSERAIQGLLYDLAGAGGPREQSSNALGLPALLQTLERERSEQQGFATIFSFLQALRASPGVNASALDNVLRRYAIEPSADALGRGETNAAGHPDALPLYRQLEAPGSVGFELYGDTPNGLALVRFFTFVGAGPWARLSVEASEAVALEVQGPGLPLQRTPFSPSPTLAIRTRQGERYVVAVRSNVLQAENHCTLRWATEP